MLDIREMIRRFRQEQGDRAISRETEIDRKTVAIWRDWAEGQGFLVGDAMPDEAAIAERMKATEAQADTGPSSSVERWGGSGDRAAQLDPASSLVRYRSEFHGRRTVGSNLYCGGESGGS